MNSLPLFISPVNFIFLLYFRGGAPSFTQKPAIVQAEGKIIFECKLNANPKPTLTWFRDDTQISEGGKYPATTDPMPLRNRHTLCCN